MASIEIKRGNATLTIQHSFAGKDQLSAHVHGTPFRGFASAPITKCRIGLEESDPDELVIWIGHAAFEFPHRKNAERILAAFPGLRDTRTDDARDAVVYANAGDEAMHA